MHIPCCKEIGRNRPMKGKGFHIIFWTIVIEALTILFRYGFNMESTRDTRDLISPFTFGIRIHHGYIGLLILISGKFFLKQKHLAYWAEIAGFSLFFSDLIHHFIVLWTIEGNPYFDLTYG